VDLWPRLVQPDGVVPAFHDREAVGPLVVAAAEVDRHRPALGLRPVPARRDDDT
jgi:hypothetical protein